MIYQVMEATNSNQLLYELDDQLKESGAKLEQVLEGNHS